MSTIIKHHHHIYQNIHRLEIGVWGISDNQIHELYQFISNKITQYKIAYCDSIGKETSAVKITRVKAANFCVEINDAIQQPQIKQLLNETDLVIYNANEIEMMNLWLILDGNSNHQLDLKKLENTTTVFYNEQSKAQAELLCKNNHKIKAICTINFEAIVTHILEKLIENTPALNGLVLSGGESTRMKENKSLLVYHQQMQWLHLYQLLQTHCPETYISCTQGNAHLFSEKKIIIDQVIGYGPLSGIISALLRHKNKAWLIVACDLPLLDESTLSYLIQERDPSKIATAYYNDESGFLEPLVTIYEPKALPVLLNMLAQGYTCPRKMLMQNDIKIVKPLNHHALKNINYPEEKEQIMKILSAQK